MVINQVHSIGDIIFLEPMFRHFWNQNGVKPIVPLRDHLLWIQKYIESADFVPESTFIWPYENQLEVHADYLPLRWANQIFRGYDQNDHHDFENMMADKYLLAGLDPQMWKQINLQLPFKKSEKLLALLGMMNHKSMVQKYVLVNENSQAGNITINPETDLPVIRMRDTMGFTLMDWFLVIQMAEENHHVSTSTFYLMQAIANHYHFESKVVIYPRPNSDGLRGISKLTPTFNFQTK